MRGLVIAPEERYLAGKFGQTYIDAALVLYALLVIAHIGSDTEVAAVLCLIMFVLLATSGREFRAKPDPRSRWTAVKLAAQFMTVAFVWGVALLSIGAHDRLVGRPSVSARVQEVLLGLVGINGPLHYRSDRFGGVVHATLGAFTLITVVLVAWLILRPAEPADGLTGEDESRLRELLAKQGSRDSLGYFALRREKRVVWSPSGTAAITGRVVDGCSWSPVTRSVTRRRGRVRSPSTSGRSRSTAACRP